ncbi:hypothetical protein EDB81DRAFT_830276 [Dactylonectria macrodidyma]|uniref:DUF6604 domain-containing protein n=1 Tax=Dactylonectria macrodidyma TaxID=307937 RepID=A0A9P9D2Q3_9HYPO|nr:hypothetical protein EDB81DRAFT_830276 [Dactylonectria macrodidyma]
MLPSSLKSIYQQYKVDTDSVANWLATTAKDNGYADNTSSSNQAWTSYESIESNAKAWRSNRM